MSATAAPPARSAAELQIVSPLLRRDYSPTCSQSMAWTDDFLVIVTTDDTIKSREIEVSLSPSVDLLRRREVEEEMTVLLLHAVDSEKFSSQVRIQVISFTACPSKLPSALEAARSLLR